MNLNTKNALFLLLFSPSTTIAASDQCDGGSPMDDIVDFLGATIDYELADRICCNNHVFAEPSGYQEEPQVMLFDRLDPNAETTFYDSVCGIPLFIAPRGRSFEDFKTESIHHGWPSFRPEETVTENVNILDGGRMESTCGTHLGHNLPDDDGDRYCIDLVCIAGSPLEFNGVTPDETVVIAREIDASPVTSTSTEGTSESNYVRNGIVLFSFVGIALLSLVAYNRGRSSNQSEHEIINSNLDAFDDKVAYQQPDDQTGELI